jgi:hypothetical protein
VRPAAVLVSLDEASARDGGAEHAVQAQLARVHGATEAFGRKDYSEAEGIVRGFMADLEDLRARYEEALKNHGMSLPY